MYKQNPNANNPITEISFEIGNDLNSCYKKLSERGFDIVEGDIRKGAGGKYCALGIKRGTSNYPIRDIIGFLTNNKEGFSIIENGHEYKMIKDGNNNGDIHKGSKGEDLYLYYSIDQTIGTPIKEIVFTSFPNRKASKMEVAQNYSGSLRNGDLDINARRGKKTPFNYIIIIR